MEYYIKIGRQKVPVSEAVYKEWCRGERKERYFKESDIGNNVFSYDALDTDEINGFALEALRWAVENGIINGYGDGLLGPQGQATRAQVAQMLKNFIENREPDA